MTSDLLYLCYWAFLLVCFVLTRIVLHLQSIYKSDSVIHRTNFHRRWHCIHKNPISVFTICNRSECTPLQYYLNVKWLKMVSHYSNCITSKLNSRVFSHKIIYVIFLMTDSIFLGMKDWGLNILHRQLQHRNPMVTRFFKEFRNKEK